MDQRRGAPIAPTGPARAVLGHSSLARLFPEKEGPVLAYKRRNGYKCGMKVHVRLLPVQSVSDTCMRQA